MPESAREAPAPIRVLIADDSPVLRERLRAELSPHPEVVVVGEVEDAAGVSGAIARLAPDLVILDLQMPGGGLAVLERFGRAGRPRFAVLTNHAEPEYRTRCAALGARTFLDKTLDFPSIADAVRTVAAEAAGSGRGWGAARPTPDFRTLAEQARDIIFRYRLTAPRGFEYVNPAATAIMGYTPEEHYADPDFLARLVHPDDRERLEALNHGQPLEPGERIRWIRRDGGIVWTEPVTSLVYDDAGTAIAIEGIARDVTAQVQAVQELRALFDDAPDAYLTLDATGRIADVNREAERLAGLPRAAMVGRGVLDLGLIGTAQRGAVQRDLARSLAGLETGPLELDLTRPDAGRTTVEVRTHALQRGGAPFVLVIARDISARVRADAERRLLSAAVEASATGVVITDCNGRVTWANPAFTALTGYETAEIIGCSTRVLKSGKQDSAFYRHLWRRITAGQVWHGELLNRRKDGSLYAEEMVITPVRASGGAITHFVAIKQDVSARIERDRRLQLSDNILQAVNNLVVAADGRGTVTYVSPSAERVLGYPAHELLGERWWSLTRHDAAGAEDERTYVRDCVAGRVPLRTEPYERMMFHRNGDPRWILWTDAPGPQGTLIGVGQDITERKRAEEQLQQARRLEVVGRLASGVAHDFNNLLTVILGESELALSSAGAEDVVRQALVEIRKSGERGRALTRRLLAYSRRGTVQPTVFSVGALVEDVATLLRRLLRENVALKLELGPDEWWVEADRAELEQVLVNLAVNARDAMPDGGRLTVSVTNVVIGLAQAASLSASPGEFVRIAVRDTGTGMSPDVLQHLFEPFFSTKPHGEGTGLGLATVHGIVTQAGGRIAVDSAVGRGTTMAVYLPRARDVSAEWPASVSPPPPAGRGESVLVVEDDPGVRRILARLLQQAGYAVLEAADLAAARTIVASSAPLDLLITDVLLPDGSGRDVADQVRVRRPAVPVVYVSGYSQEEMRRRLLLDEAATFLHKPVPGDELLRAVGDALRRPSPASPATDRARALVVDDDADTRRLIEWVLWRGGHVPTGVDTAEAALARLAAGGIDLVLLDGDLPGTSGFSLAARIRDLPGGRDLAVIMVSGLDTLDDRQAALASGCDAFLAKPFDVDDLAAAVRRALAGVRNGGPPVDAGVVQADDDLPQDFVIHLSPS